MKIVRFLSLFFALISISSASFSDTGCLYTSGYIYTVPNGNFTGDPPGAPGLGSYPNYRYASPTDRTIDTSVFCKQSTSSPCRIDGSIGVWGFLINYTVTQCPLDDYILLLLLASGGFGFFVLRKRLLIG